MAKQTAQEIKRKFNAENYSRVHADLPKEMVARFKTAVKTRGDTIAEVLRKAIERYLNGDKDENSD
jgi:predicted DNA-binding protein